MNAPAPRPRRHPRPASPPARIRLQFSKMHGLGNDFMVIDLISQQAELDASRIARLADRHFGIGFDQLLIVEAPSRPDADFRYRIFNADGSEVQQCGNGARCFAKFVRERALTNRRVIRVETLSGLIRLEVLNDGRVMVNMGVPRLAPAALPFVAEQQAVHYTLQVGGQTQDIMAVSMGNPHAVLLVDSVDTAPVASLGPAIENHERFPERVNVGFLQVLDRRHVRLRVFERGTGETLACGTGACAAVVAGHLRGLLDRRVRVDLPGGRLDIDWAGEGHPVMMSGPAETVFDGEIDW